MTNHPCRVTAETNMHHNELDRSEREVLGDPETFRARCYVAIFSGDLTVREVFERTMFTLSEDAVRRQEEITQAIDDLVGEIFCIHTHKLKEFIEARLTFYVQQMQNEADRTGDYRIWPD